MEATKTCRLLMVDDDPAMLEIVRDVAEPLGMMVETFTKSEAFKAAARQPADIIILDLSIPQTDGIELLRHLSQVGTRARIFILSGFEPTVRRMAFDLGTVGALDMAGIIPKPVRIADLRTMLIQARDAPSRAKRA